MAGFAQALGEAQLKERDEFPGFGTEAERRAWAGVRVLKCSRHPAGPDQECYVCRCAVEMRRHR